MKHITKETAAAQDDLNHAIYSISEWQSFDNNGTKLISNPAVSLQQHY